MFVFRKKNKGGEKVDHLLRLVREDPDNMKNRLRLADHYVRSGDKKSAIREYQSTAHYLQKEGFNLKAISIYKKISSLGGMSLTDHRSLAAIYTDSGLFAEAKKAYREILRIEPGDSETLAALKRLDEEGDIPPAREREETIENTEATTSEDADAVPIETLLVAPTEETHPDASTEFTEIPVHEMDLTGLYEEGATPSETGPGDHASAFGIDVTKLDDSLETAQPVYPASPDDDDALHQKILPDIDLTRLTDEAEGISEEAPPRPEDTPDLDITSRETDDFLKTTPLTDNDTAFQGDISQEQILPDMDLSDLSDDMGGPSENAGAPQKGSEIDLTNLQFDDIFQIEPTTEEGELDGTPSASADSIPDSTEESLNPSDDNETAFPEPSAPEGSLPPSPLRELEEQVGTSGEDPDLHYHLGVAYREMELTDRAIEEFTKALDRRSKSLECLTMLAKCYFEKGLFQESAAFIHRALTLDNLTQDQIDLLHRQLEEAEAVGKLG